MANHPNRKVKSQIDIAVGVLLQDARSGYAEADTEGKRNIRRNITVRLQEMDGGWPADTLVAEHIRCFWRQP